LAALFFPLAWELAGFAFGFGFMKVSLG